jgi:hypothetical protein
VPPATETTPGTPIPQINVNAPRAPVRVAAPPPRPAAPPPAPAAPPPTAEQQVVQTTDTLDQKRDENLQPKVGTAGTTLSQQDIQSLPQGTNSSIREVVTQLPGVSQDSTASGDFHVRNDHANVQYRINGIQMPDGISGFGEFLDAGLFSKFSLITGALPAQYGLHTTGILDITTKSGAALSGGSISVYGGSNSEITPSFEYDGVSGNSEYFVTGRYLSDNLGLESPTGNIHTPHDHTELGRLFAYTSTLLDNTTRFVTFSGISAQRYQIPNNPGQMINTGGFAGAPGNPNPGVYSAWGVTDFNSANINENQYEKNSFAVMAWQRLESWPPSAQRHRSSACSARSGAS